jgi:hypothetical protein
MENDTNPLDAIYESKCFTCRHRLSRVIKPVTQEDKEYYLDLMDIDDQDSTDLYIEQHRCLMTDEDLDGVILECNQYERANDFKLIREYEF